MRNPVILPRSRRVPFIPLATPFETIISCFTGDEADEVYNEEYFWYLMSSAANGEPNIEIGASPELARQINAYFGRTVAHSDILD
mgnify:FL=1